MRKYEDQINKIEGVKVKYYDGRGNQSLEQAIANIVRIEIMYGKQKFLTVKQATDWINKDFPMSVTEQEVIDAVNGRWASNTYMRENKIHVNRGGGYGGQQ